MAQIDEQRLIPLALETMPDPNDDTNTPPRTITTILEETIPGRDFVVYGRARKGHPTDFNTGDEPIDFTGDGAYEAGIERGVDYQQIPNSTALEPNSDRMPDLETFFAFGGTLELITLQTDDSTLTKYDIAISEIMWAIDEGFDEDAGPGTVQIPNPAYDPVNDPIENATITIDTPQLDKQVIQLNNAGFNLLRSESRDGVFTVINTDGLIQGHGTSSEQHVYSYTDKTAKPNVVYYYRIEDVSFDGAQQTLTTVRLKGHISATGKLTTTWGDLKLEE